MGFIAEALDKLNEKLYNDGFNYVDDDYLGDEQDQIANEFFEMINSLINEEKINELFINNKVLNDHFKWHCIGNTVKKSTSKDILYDFINKQDYIDYEKKISSLCSKPNIIITNLGDIAYLIKAFKKLFVGNCVLQFTPSCGFVGPKNDTRYISFYAYSSDVTTNYSGGNTIDLCVMTRNMKTLTLYAIDAHKVENKINGIIKNHNKFFNNIDLKFNND